jgi:hypothetical protein
MQPAEIKDNLDAIAYGLTEKKLYKESHRRVVERKRQYSEIAISF